MIMQKIGMESPRRSEIREQHNPAKSPLDSELDDMSIENQSIITASGTYGGLTKLPFFR